MLHTLFPHPPPPPGSHFDEYILLFKRFRPGPPANKAFAPPPACAGHMQQQVEEAGEGPRRRILSLGAQILSLLPSSRMGLGESGAGTLVHGTHRAGMVRDGQCVAGVVRAVGKVGLIQLQAYRNSRQGEAWQGRTAGGEGWSVCEARPAGGTGGCGGRG